MFDFVKNLFVKEKAPKGYINDHMKLYCKWHNMVASCYDKDNLLYKTYGALGIKVCKEWRSNYMNFFKWALNNGYEETAKKVLRRKDMSKDFSPSNCYFCDKSSCGRKRLNEKYTYNGQSLTMEEWAELLDVKVNSFKVTMYRHNKDINKVIEHFTKERVVKNPSGKITKDIRYNCAYRCWANMKNTVRLDKSVKLCKSWLDFNNFVAWLITNGYNYPTDKKFRLKRLNSNKGFSPKNCTIIMAKQLKKGN